MNGPILVLDIETTPDPDLPAPPKKKGSKKGDDFPPIPSHRIVAIGAALLDAFGRLRRLWIEPPSPEPRTPPKGKRRR